MLYTLSEIEQLWEYLSVQYETGSKSELPTIVINTDISGYMAESLRVGLRRYVIQSKGGNLRMRRRIAYVAQRLTNPMCKF